MIVEIFSLFCKIKDLPSDTFNAIAVGLLAGITSLVQTDWTVFSVSERWEMIMHLLSMTSMHPEASKYSFECASLLISEKTELSLTLENFGECVDLLISFAASGNIEQVRNTSPVGMVGDVKREKTYSPIY